MDADILRIILAVFGVLVIAGLYLWERRRRRQDHEESDDEDSGPVDEDGQEGKREPRLGPWEGYGDAGEHPAVGGIRRDNSDDAQSSEAPPTRSDGAPGSPVDVQAQSEQREPDHEPPPAPPEPRPPQFPPGPLMLTLHVAAGGAPFEGSAIVQAAEHCGLEPGELDIYHCTLGDEGHRQTLFSVANMVKPGTFPFGAMAEFQSPGLTLFAQFDGTPDDPERMDELLDTAHGLSEDLGGEVRDGNREPLTPESEGELRERVTAFVAARLAADDQ